MQYFSIYFYLNSIYVDIRCGQLNHDRLMMEMQLHQEHNESCLCRCLQSNKAYDYVTKNIAQFYVQKIKQFKVKYAHKKINRCIHIFTDLYIGSLFLYYTRQYFLDIVSSAYDQLYLFVDIWYMMMKISGICYYRDQVYVTVETRYMLLQISGVCYCKDQVYVTVYIRYMLLQRSGICYCRYQVYVTVEIRCMLLQISGICFCRYQVYATIETRYMLLYISDIFYYRDQVYVTVDIMYMPLQRSGICYCKYQVYVTVDIRYMFLQRNVSTDNWCYRVQIIYYNIHQVLITTGSNTDQVEKTYRWCKDLS